MGRKEKTPQYLSITHQHFKLPIFKKSIILPIVVLIFYFIAKLLFYSVTVFSSNKNILYIADHIEPLINNAETYPYITIVGTAVLGLFIDYVLEFSKYKSLLDISGIVSFQRPDELSDYKSISIHLEESEGNQLSIWSITGKKTICDKETYLHKFVLGESQYRLRTIKILLLDPSSNAFINVAKSKHIPVDDYQKDINTTIALLKDAYVEHKNIELRQYNFEPSWRMVIVNGSLWLQYYATGINKNSAIYGLRETKQKGHSLYYIACKEFERVWARSTPVNLDNTKEYKSSNILDKTTINNISGNINVHNINTENLKLGHNIKNNDN